MSSMLSIIFAASFLVASTSAAGEAFSYDNQGAWPGACVDSNSERQSPINIQTSSLTPNSALIDLEFDSSWNTPVDGVFGNGGHNVQFSPANVASPSVTTRNHLGTYRVLQMHMHWGRNDREGSEHTVDNEQYSLELHFVHTKIGETDTTAGDYLAVVGVLAEADATMELSGVWAQLNASSLQTLGSNFTVTGGLTYSDLLPSSREYYYYIGSLTTPGCDEIVQWFVLRNSIRVPAEFLTYLRQLDGANANEQITFNFRAVQPLGERSVYVVGNGAEPAVKLVSLTMLAVVLLVAYLV